MILGTHLTSAVGARIIGGALHQLIACLTFIVNCKSLLRLSLAHLNVALTHLLDESGEIHLAAPH